ncbi:tautomerase family protein [Paenibacillus sp. WST5]|uniref:Tautomerase family protein n=1 Tax=Paenibacillus sedimenti TaxID=2770274 RepID=A0A926QLW6_9BACL|nr:tautomerase family protein [Paenibacillus sedimenti]
MPLLRFDLIEGRDKASLKKLLEVVHTVVVEVFDVPQRDRYQIVHEHPAAYMIIEDTGLGLNRTNNLVVLLNIRRRLDHLNRRILFCSNIHRFIRVSKHHSLLVPLMTITCVRPA